MKTRALAVNVITQKEKIITAFDAVYLREFDGENFKNYKFYYADSGRERFEMTPKFIRAKNTAFFAFKSDNIPDCTFEDEGESITHFAAKKALARMKKLRLVDMKTKTEYQFNVIKGENEKRFLFDKPYYADVYFQFDSHQNKEMKKYFFKWKEQLAVEIFVSHKNSHTKSRAFAENGIPIFEVKIPKSTREKFELESPVGLSKNRIDRAINNMEKMFEKGIRGVLISDPETEEYKEMCRYKEEIQQFKIARDNAEKEFLEAQEKLQVVNNLLKEAEKKQEYYDTIETKVAELENSIESYKNHPIKFLLRNLKK